MTLAVAFLVHALDNAYTNVATADAIKNVSGQAFADYISKFKTANNMIGAGGIILVIALVNDCFFFSLFISK